MRPIHCSTISFASFSPGRRRIERRTIVRFVRRRPVSDSDLFGMADEVLFLSTLIAPQEEALNGMGDRPLMPVLFGGLAVAARPVV